MRKLVVAVLSLGAISASWLMAPAADACWTPRVGSFNGPQVCVIDDDILK